MNDIILSGMAWASSLRDAISSRMKDEGGQDLIEYAVLVGAIGLGAAIALFALGPAAFDTMAAKVEACVTFTGDCSDALP